MRILVIGGTRFIDPTVVALLSRLGHVVTVFHRGQSKQTFRTRCRTTTEIGESW